MASTLMAAPASAAVSVSISINVPVYPSLVRIPSYPVYYAPSLQANYFFYDGLYWVFADDGWYQSPWYNGPWYTVDRFEVPVYLLRVPVRYYRVQPTYFHGWAHDAPPRWGDHWGSSWQSRRAGWDRWNRSSAPAPAPLPVYQRAYSGDRYPVTVTQQATLQTRSYTYQPRETVSRQQFEERRTQARVATQVQQAEQRQAPQHQERVQQARVPQQQEHVQPQQRPEHVQPQRPEHPQQHENRGQEKGENRGQEKGKGHDHDEKEKGKGKEKEKD